MLIRRPSDIAPSEITPHGVYLRRREFLAGAAALGLIGLRPLDAEPTPRRCRRAKSPLSTTDEPPTPLKDITTYNNFYEFGTDKGDPAGNAAHADHHALDGQDRRPGRQARRLRARRPRQAA